MDFQKVDEYLRAHWPAVLLMAVVVIPGTAGVVTFLHPNSANGSSQQDAKLLTIETRLHEITARIDALDKFYRWSRDDQNRVSEEDWSTLGNHSNPTASIPSAFSSAKGQSQ
jgi:hypothetical protein